MPSSHASASGNSRSKSTLSGIININKPQGLTSHDVVAQVRRITGQKKAGHAGTLDPLATGVLPVVLGGATRLVEYLADAGKAYRAVAVFGATTDTYDREGVVTPVEGAVAPTREAVEAALGAFRGTISQLPPMHSAIKVGGKKLYELAREGTEIERTPRTVTISTLTLENYEPSAATLFIECSKGTYIRSLAYDLGAALGVGAYLDALERTRHGPFSIESSVTLEGLREAFERGEGDQYVQPAETILSGWRFYEVSPEEELQIRQGKFLALEPPTNDAAQDAPMAARTRAGELLAVLYWQADKELWHPRKVFTSEGS